MAAHVLLEVPDDRRDLFRLAVAGELEGHVSQVGSIVEHQESRTSRSTEHISFIFNCKCMENIYHAEENGGSWQPRLHHARWSLESAEPTQPLRPQQRRQEPACGVGSASAGQGQCTHQLGQQRWGLQTTPHLQRTWLTAGIKQWLKCPISAEYLLGSTPGAGCPLGHGL